MTEYEAVRRWLRRGGGLLAVALAGAACEQVEVTTAEVASIEVAPTEAAVEVDATTSLSASVLGSNGAVLSGRQVSWTSLDPAVATVNGSGTVRGVGPGTARIEASAEGATAQAVVHVSSPPPSIRLSTSSLAFAAEQGGSNPATQTVAVSEPSGRSLGGLGVEVAYPAGQPGGWLMATLGAPSAPTNLTVGAASGALPAGTYTATIRVVSATAANSPQSVAVEFVVSARPPRMALSRTDASFTATAGGGNPSAVQISITNTGGGTVSGLARSITYGSGQPQGWLAADLSGSSAPATLTLRATTGSLAAGSYSATVRVTSGTAANSPVDVTVSFTVEAQAPLAPQAPTGLQASAASTSRIDLSWSQAGILHSRFEIQRSTDGASFATVHTTSSGLPRSYSDTGLSAGTTYHYRVRACNAVGCSGWSSSASATTHSPQSAPSIPDNVTATAPTSTTVVVAWTAPGNQTGYRVRMRSGTGGQWDSPAQVPGSATSYTETGLRANRTYQFQVSACNAVGCSQYSSPVTVTTPR